MDAHKMVTIQHQIRQNQEEFNEYVKGLSSWADDMKAKEEKAKSAVSEPASVDVPPVRNSLLKKKKKKKVKIATEQNSTGDSETKKAKKIGAYDYRAWDKFDAEAAAEAVEGEASTPKEEEEYETDEEWEEERRLLLSKEEKEKGNAHFKAGRWDAAVESYTTALRLDPSNAVLLTNRAMAQIRADRLAAAETDCSAALRLHPDNCKALYRRALARKGLGRAAEALADLERLLRLDPDSRAARAEAEALERTVRPTGEVKPVTKPPHARSQRPLRRLPIEEVGLAESRPAPPPDPALRRFLAAKEEKEEEATVEDAGKEEATVEAAVKETEKEEAAEPAQADFQLPGNFRQFEATFATLKARGDAQLHAFLLAIPPQRYCGLFGQCLEPRHLNALVSALHAAPDDAQVVGRVRALRTVPRFSLLAMMSGGREREAVRGLRQRLRAAGRIAEKEFEEMGREFRL